MTAAPLAPFAAALALFMLDQWTKRLVRARGASGPILRGPLVKIQGVRHGRDLYARPGVRAGLALGWCAALGGALVLVRSGGWLSSPAAHLGLALALGGAAGNLADVLRRRYILDFIDLGWWPVFNVADVGIVAGLLLALWPAG
jgi:signal peptidase II